MNAVEQLGITSHQVSITAAVVFIGGYDDVGKENGNMISNRRIGEAKSIIYSKGRRCGWANISALTLQ